MSAREIIAKDLMQRGIHTRPGKDADCAITALEAAGYRHLAPGEFDPDTIERCAAEADKAAEQRAADGDPEGAGVIEDLAADIRSLKGEGNG